MTLDQLRIARRHLNLSLLAHDAGRERTYYHQALAGRRRLTADDEAAIDAALAKYGLSPLVGKESRPPRIRGARGNGEHE